MAAAIPEAVETASTAGAVASGSARRKARKEVTRQQREGSAHQQDGGQQRRQQQISRTSRRAGRGVLKARVPGSYSYQPVILAEFLVAIVLVSMSPLAKGGTSEAQTKGSPSPYSVNTLKQLVAIGGVYFVLALVARSNRLGRFAGWFGGLVLVGLGLAEYLTGDLGRFFGIFGPSATAAIPSTSSPQANPNLPGITTPGAPGAGIPGVGQDIGVNTTTQSITFSQPGVATTTETSPGVTVT